jgi:hypothetical protein
MQKQSRFKRSVEQIGKDRSQIDGLKDELDKWQETLLFFEFLSKKKVTNTIKN